MKRESRSSRAWKGSGVRAELEYRFSFDRDPLFTPYEGCRWAPVPAEPSSLAPHIWIIAKGPRARNARRVCVAYPREKIQRFIPRPGAYNRVRRPSFLSEKAAASSPG